MGVSKGKLYRKYDGMLYLKAVLEVMHPYAFKISSDAILKLARIEKHDNKKWSAFLDRADAICYKIRIASTPNEKCNIGIIQLLKILSNILDINSIQLKVQKWARIS